MDKRRQLFICIIRQTVMSTEHTLRTSYEQESMIGKHKGIQLTTAKGNV